MTPGRNPRNFIPAELKDSVPPLVPQLSHKTSPDNLRSPEWEFLVGDTEIREALFQLLCRLQAVEMSDVFIPLRLNYIRHAFTQARDGLDKKTTNLNLDQTRLQLFEEEWFIMCNNLQSVLVQTYDQIQEVILSIPTSVQAALEEDENCDVRHAFTLVWLKKKGVIQILRHNYEKQVAEYHADWTENMKEIEDCLDKVHDAAPQLLDVPFNYQPEWDNGTQDGEDEDLFPAIPMPIIPNLPKEAVRTAQLSKAFSK